MIMEGNALVKLTDLNSLSAPASNPDQIDFPNLSNNFYAVHEKEDEKKKKFGTISRRFQKNTSFHSWCWFNEKKYFEIWNKLKFSQYLEWNKNQ